MLTSVGGASENQGAQGVHMAAVAEQLEAVFWNMVVSAMETTGLKGANLGTGADLYNGIATRALSGQLFGGLSGSLTKTMIGQISSQMKPQPTGLADPARIAPLLTPSHLNAPPSCVSGPPSSQATIAQATAFARSIWPCLQDSAAQLNVSPVALLSQAALETGWGSSAPTNNIFGVKARAGQAATPRPTLEYTNGAMRGKTAAFAAYASPADAMTHYTSLVRTAYPGAVGAKSVATYANALAQGGYATDPNYADKLIAVARSPLMSEVLQSLGVREPSL